MTLPDQRDEPPMNPIKLTIACLLGVGLVPGCGPTALDAPPPQSPPVISRPAERPTTSVASTRPNPADFTWETDQDRTFAEFLRDKSGGMLRKASVGIARGGKFQVILDRSVAPDDTLDLTKSLMAGARKDFPDRPITLIVFDPTGELILKARSQAGQEVKYQIANEATSTPGRTAAEEEASKPATTPASNRSGTTANDRKFAEWAEEHGKAYLRYVEADLERHGRLWFGVTREVKPADVPALTKSLLEGARKEFPRGELVASVFDPEGNKIGKAYLTGSSSIRWER